ncbi:MAG: alcohol dehydrogenase catalytic domain-containing protein [Acidobacteriota bacterium]
MKAAVLEAPQKISVREIPSPAPLPHQVLVRVGAVGLCGTDIHIFRGEGNYNMAPSGRVIPLEEQPQILGHEFCGLVVDTGGEVKGVRPGDRVVVDQGLNCYSAQRQPICEYCDTGDSHQCQFYQEHGITGVQGAMADLVAVPAVNTVEIPENLGFAEAVMSEPLACVLHAVSFLERAGGRFTFDGERKIRSILICGSGPAGLLFVQYLRNVKGFQGLIIVADTQDGKLALARQYGAECLNVSQVNLIEAVAELTAGNRVECLIDACGSAQVYEQIPWLLRKQGTVLLYGHGHRGKDIGIINLVQFLEPTLVSPIGASGHFTSDHRPAIYAEAAEAIRSRTIDVKTMVTHRFQGLEAIQQALTTEYSRPTYIKGIVQLSD